MAVTIFTDGSSKGNPGPGGWGAIICEANEAVSDKLQAARIIEIGARENKTTNNRMELTAAIEALTNASCKLQAVSCKITLYTDSAYVVNGITKWIYGWEKSNWKTKANEAVLNQDLWQKLKEVADGLEIEWKILPGHVGILGNERCDEIATSFADMKKVNLYMGPAKNYDLKILPVVIPEVLSKGTKKSGKAYSYLSKVDGVIEIHKSWSECEARVKGKTGARFKKSLSKEQEEEIREDFKK